jgi:hypothetical protein
MKESVYSYKAYGTDFSIELEILMAINRPLTDTDHKNLRIHAENIVASMHEESIRLNPKTHIEAIKEKNEIISLFGDRAILVEEIPNGYCSNSCCKHKPWFIVTTTKGRIKIGWRKRVINIDWSDSMIEYDADALFHTEDVTKDDKYIHAWGLEKAKEYINILLS